MKIKENISLKSFNTFNLDYKARFFTEINTIKDLDIIFSNSKLQLLPRLILGEGSNILFTKNFEGIILKISLKGFKIIKENYNNVIIKIAAGENWNNFVKWSINHNFSGLENLSFIPGTVGASPIQNIGAYGVEIKDILIKIEVYEIATGKIKNLNCEDCQLKYRDSIFKNRWKNQYIILSISLILQKRKPILKVSYTILQKELENMQVNNFTSKNISQAIINIRKRILPNPKKIGNGGSFFKNPIIVEELYKKLNNKYFDIVGYPISKNKIKISGAQLIEKIGWKGKKFGQTGVYEKQALVLVNYGKSTGEEIYNFSEKIIQNIQKNFHVLLEREIFVI